MAQNLCSGCRRVWSVIGEELKLGRRKIYNDSTNVWNKVIIRVRVIGISKNNVSS